MSDRSLVFVGRPAETIWKPFVELLRPSRWIKNLIAYAPLVLAMKVHEPNLFGLATLCVLSLCLVSGANYIFNDIFDALADKANPRQGHRPVASGQVSRDKAIVFASIFAFAGLTLSFLVRPTLFLVVLAFFALNLLYSSVLKHRVLVDVMCLATGLVLRAVAGAIAVRVAVSEWFLLCMTLGALFLALEKRRNELYLFDENSSIQGQPQSRYSPALLDRIEALVVASLLTSYATYTFLSAHGQWMMITVPFVIYGIMRYQLLSSTRKTTASPEQILVRDRPLCVTIACWWLTCACVVYDAPQAAVRTTQALDSLQIPGLRESLMLTSSSDQLRLKQDLPSAVSRATSRDSRLPTSLLGHL